MDGLFYISIALLFGFLGGKLAGKVKLPGVLGYLIIGVLFGPSLLDIFKEDTLQNLGFFPALALSIVAFTIGSEMKLQTLKDLGSGLGVIILAESLGAFFLVTIGVYLVTGKLFLALIFGALAPASAPAGTVAVLQELKAKGRLTNALYAVVGLDDGLAIMIFAIAAALAETLFVGKAVTVTEFITGPIFEIIGSIILGSLLGLISGFCMRKLFAPDSILAVGLGSVLLCTGIAEYFHFSLILSNLVLGMIFVNVFPISNRKAYKALESISLPVYIVFFFLAGATLHISLLPSMGFIGLIYIVCRTAGLMGGSYFGALISKQSRIIRNYLGLGILSQAGVAIGLGMLAAAQFRALGQGGADVAITVMNTIAATTIFFEIIGPICTRIAVNKSGEAGLNVTEEDLILAYNVKDVMNTDMPEITSGTSLSEVIRIFSDTSYYYYPIIDSERKLTGAVTLDGIRNTFSTQELNDWLVALDIAQPVVATVQPKIPLAEALEKAQNLYVRHLPVTKSKDDKTYLGLLDCDAVKRALSAEVLSRQQKADTMHVVSS
ncbi:MAG: cation:proton antiporter [Sedimentisphaerales bacterium]|nr:cation:proton antiporter [Sedimentisphaerales bacterium]